MSFWAFYGILFIIITLIILLFVRRWYRKENKKTAFGLFLGYFSILLALLITETGIYIRGANTTGINPSFVWAGYSRPANHPNLPYLRATNIRWEGKAHGDLAILNYDRDPYARDVIYYTDKDGFRNHRDVQQADLIAVGDSYTEAGGVAEGESYLARLGKMTRMTTKNLGVAGYNTPYASIILGEYGVEMQPKVAILQVAESNDLIENERYYNWVQDGKPARAVNEIEVSSYDAWKLRSPLYTFYQAIFPLSLSKFDLQGRFVDESGKSYLTRFLSPPRPDMKPKGYVGWDVMIGSMIRMKELCEERDIFPIVLLIPDKMTVMRDFVDFEPQAQEILAQYPPIFPQESLSFYLGKLCDELGMSWVDATPALYAAAQKGKMVYLPMDTHLSAAGHEVVAAELSKLFNFSKASPRSTGR